MLSGFRMMAQGAALSGTKVLAVAIVGVLSHPSPSLQVQMRAKCESPS